MRNAVTNKRAFRLKLIALIKYIRRPGIIASFAIILATAVWFAVPPRMFNVPASYVIEDSHGTLMSASIASDGQWRFPHNDSVPAKFINCITVFEDKRFFSHPGVDPFAMCRAIKSNLNGKSGLQGASTLTMQVIRLSRQPVKRTFFEKIAETFLAFRLEAHYSKDRIMALYASNAPFGGNVVGLDAAAWRYFGREAKSLSWGEMAALAVLPNAPSLVHPGKNREILLKKRNFLIDKLVANHSIDRSTGELSKLEPLPGAPLPLPQFAPHLLQRFRQESGSSATIIRTTIDLPLQQQVSGIVQQHHRELRGNGINNVAALVVDVETGNVLSYVGNVAFSNDPELESSVDIIKAPRSPGSTLKPILYAAALSDGIILPHTLMPDIPTRIGSYVPKNFDGGFDGAVPASVALARSLNIPAVKLLQQYKYQRMYELLKQSGISTFKKPANHYGLSLILGGSEVTMWDMAALYASLARSLNHEHQHRGRIHKNDFHTLSYHGGIPEVSEPVPGSANIKLVNALDPLSIYYTFRAMEEVMRPGEEGLWQQFSSSQRIAWKTGTSFGFRDGWAIGVTPKYVVVVWTGNADGEGRPGLVGVHSAAPIMFDIFRHLPASEWFAVPQFGLTRVRVCKQSGLRAGIDCPDVDTMPVPPNGLRAPLCPYHKMIHLDRSERYRVNANCETVSEMVNKPWFTLTPAMEWYYQQKNFNYKSLPPFKPGCEYSETGRQMELIYPGYDSKIYVPLEVNGIRGKTIFTAAHRGNETRIYWSLDDEFLCITERFHQVAISPPPGTHIITLVDANGETISRQFEILDREQQ
jgi:penicillin-binding protein 1C